MPARDLISGEQILRHHVGFVVGRIELADAIAAKLAQLDVDICAMQEVVLDPANDLPALLRTILDENADARPEPC